MPCRHCHDSGILLTVARYHPGRSFEVDNAGRCYNCGRYGTDLDAMRALAGQGQGGGFIVWTECYEGANKWETYYVRTDAESAARLQHRLLRDSMNGDGVPAIFTQVEEVPPADLNATIVRPLVQKAAQVS